MQKKYLQVLDFLFFLWYIEKRLILCFVTVNR